MFLKNVLKFNTSLFKKNRNVNKYESKPDLSNLDGNWKNLLIRCDHEYSHIISDMLKK